MAMMRFSNLYSLVLFSFSVFTMLSMFSYDPSDFALLRDGIAGYLFSDMNVMRESILSTSNMGGYYGHVLAGYLYSALGLCAWVFSGLLMLCSYSLAVWKRQTIVLLFLSSGIVVASMSILLFVYSKLTTSSEASFSGSVGVRLGGYLSENIGTAGASVVALCLILFSAYVISLASRR